MPMQTRQFHMLIYSPGARQQAEMVIMLDVAKFPTEVEYERLQTNYCSY